MLLWKTIDAPVLYSDNVSNIKVENIKIVGTINQSPDSHDIRNNLIGFYLNCNGDPTSGEKTGCNNITLKNVEVKKTVVMEFTLKERLTLQQLI
jgi:hypothetical protein